MRLNDPATTKSQRSANDCQAPLGVATTFHLERLACSLGGMDSPPPYFANALDVPNGGVLFALPALMANGLIRHTEKNFQLPKGYYGLITIFLMAAFMLLARIRTAEGLWYCAPGEWGKLLGMDRIPEVKTFREKIAHLSNEGNVKEWSAQLCQDWMNECPDQASFLYIDGHVRVYHGQANVPKHYVSRQKLCLRGNCDYWVNAMDSSPFMVIPKDVDPGLLSVLENEIVPLLEEGVPNQPTEEALQKDSLLHRFVLIYDREGYSPKFMRRMKEKRIACISYNKRPGENWPVEEFRQELVKLTSGEYITMKLAERGTRLKGLWVREIRRLTESGHQTSVITTAYRLDRGLIAMGMFSRWSQENFFKYMAQHYSLDHLMQYAAADVPGHVKVVNPRYRQLDGQVRSHVAKLNRKKAIFGAMTIEGELNEAEMEKFLVQKVQLQEEISAFEAVITELKTKRSTTKKHILVSELSEEDRIKTLNSKSKDFLDTIKMICYRAESAMVKIAREKMSRQDDARSFMRALYQTSVDIIPDKEAQVLRIRLHHLTTASASETARHLCAVLNQTETIYPGTQMRILYEMVSS